MWFMYPPGISVSPDVRVPPLTDCAIATAAGATDFELTAEQIERLVQGGENAVSKYFSANKVDSSHDEGATHMKNHVSM